MIKKTILSFFLIIFSIYSLYSQTPKQGKVKRFPHGNYNLKFIAKDTTLVVEVLTITKTKGIEIILNKNGVVEKKKKKVAYLIKCASSDNICRTIVSLSSKINGYSKIKVGEKYKLFLIPYFEEDCMPGDGFEVIKVNNVIISNVWVLGINVYTTPNLIDLFYIPSEKINSQY